MLGSMHSSSLPLPLPGFEKQESKRGVAERGSERFAASAVGNIHDYSDYSYIPAIPQLQLGASGVAVVQFPVAVAYKQSCS